MLETNYEMLEIIHKIQKVYEKVKTHQKSLVTPIENDGNAICSMVRHETHLNSWNNTEMYQASFDVGNKHQNII